jgi:hypothetical protein
MSTDALEELKQNLRTEARRRAQTEIGQGAALTGWLGTLEIDSYYVNSIGGKLQITLKEPPPQYLDYCGGTEPGLNKYEGERFAKELRLALVGMRTEQHLRTLVGNFGIKAAEIDLKTL